MKAFRRIGIAGGLISVGVALGLWIARPHKANVDLGAAPTQYVPSGTLTLVDSSGVELAALVIDAVPNLGNSLDVELFNGPDGLLGRYFISGLGSYLTLDGPMDSTRAPFGAITFDIDPSGSFRVDSKSPNMSEEVKVPLKAASKPPRFSKQWWMDILMSTKKPETLQSLLPSEDSRLVRRDGTPFAVCGRDRYGLSAIVFVSSDYRPQARMYLQPLPTQGHLAASTFEVFDRNGDTAALLETAESQRGPRLSVASEDRLNNTGYGLFPLDPSGTKLDPNSAPPWPNDGIVDWLAQPIYRAKLPLRIVDAAGKVIWSTGKSGLQ